MSWSLEDYCASQQLSLNLEALPESSRDFIARLGLPSLHPYYNTNYASLIHEISSPVQLPPQGPLLAASMEDLHNHSRWQATITWFYQTVPPFLAFVELWLRLFAGYLAPLLVLYLLCYCQQHKDRQLDTSFSFNKQRERRDDRPLRSFRVAVQEVLCLLALASSTILMTDSLYVLEYGSAYGFSLFVTSLSLSQARFRSSVQHDERPFLGRQRSHFALVLVFLIATLTWDFESKSGFNLGTPTDVHIRIKPGLYYDHQQNPLIKSAVEQFWPTKLRTYQPTPWILTGDARTGLPFFFNHKVEFLDWKRVFLTVPDDGEVLALDIAFPETGYDATKPIFLILIGANGGSNEEYCRDLAARRTAAGSTVVVLVSRGLMDMPLVTGNIFRADRLSDVHAAATTIRRAMMNGTNQMLAGVGYSMGAIVLNNYVATYGSDCALSAGFSVSGALDCRLEMDFVRPKRVWQPMIADFSRKRFVAKWGERIKARLSQDELIRFLRVTNVVDLDKFLAVAYYKPKYRDLLHYYSDMGALGDIPIDILQNGDDPNTTASESYESTMSSFHIEKARIWNLSIPLCVLHAFDDPIATWRGIAANQGFLHPESLVQSGQGNLLLLLTEKGGHIGWPTGLFPFSRGWEFVSETAASFADAISQASQYLEQVDGSNSKKNNTTSKSGSLLSSNTCPVLPIQPQKVIRKDIIQL